MSSFKAPVFLTRCEHLAVFTVDGDDARTFLQSQLTQDVAAISPERAALAGFCTAQGRLWGSMLLAQSPESGGFLGVSSSDLTESLIKRLRMFVLRSKVAINPVPTMLVYGMALSAQDVDPLSGIVGAALPQAVWASASTPVGTFVRLPVALGSPEVRMLLLARLPEFEQLVTDLGEQARVLSQSDAWQSQDIRAGLAWVTAATQDLFIAQTLNLDLIGGVSFSKGCYPGQEVIARAHYRGTVKRRMHLASVIDSTEDMKPGMDVFESGDPDNPVGRLVNVASDTVAADGQAGKTWVLFEAPFKSLEAASLRVGSASGPELLVSSLPYEVAQQ